MKWLVRARQDPDYREPDRLVLKRVDLAGEDFSGLVLDQLYAEASRFTGCRFERMVVGDTVFGSSHARKDCLYLDCSFDGSRFDMSPYGGYSRFERCSFRNVRIFDWLCFSVELIDCVFDGARIEQAYFHGEVPREDVRRLKRKRNEFRGNDFSQAELIDVDFRTGIDLSLQKLPSGPDYYYVADLAEAVRIGREHLEEFEDPEVREDAEVVLNLAEENLVADRQRQKLYHLLTYPPGDRAGLLALYDVWSREMG